MDDWDLLRQYASTSSQEAFRSLVGRYVDFVYSAALRQVGNRHLAEDVTQAVFLILSQKAGEVARQKPGVLAGWLFKVTRFTSANAIKIESRRRKHESKGQTMNHQQSDDSAADWAGLAPHLDAALSELGTVDRDSVLLRFFANKSYREIGEELGISEEAAKKRVARSIEKLREILAKTGISLPAIGLAALLTSHSIQAAPASLIAVCGTSAWGTAGIGFAKGVSLIMAVTRAKLVMAAVLLALFLTGTSGVVIQKLTQLAKANPAGTPQPPPIAIAQPIIAQPTVAGIVRSPTGEPLPWAEVLLATQAKDVNVYSPDPSGVSRAVTADDGSFIFNVPPGPCQVVVRHQLGYAHATREQLETGADIKLKPWGKVEGIAKIGSKPAAGETITLFRGSKNPEDPYSMLIYLGQTTTADADGHFKFDRVVPGYARVYRRLPPPWKLVAADKVIEVEAGKTLKVALGGQGRPVIGHIAVPDTLTDKIDWKFARPGTTAFNAFIGPAGVSYKFNGSVTPAPDWPKDPFDAKKNLTWEQLRVQHEEWLASPAGRKFWMEMTLETNCVINPDGTFRFEDVVVGKHKLLISIWHGNSNSHPRVAEINLPVEIGDLSAKGGQTDEPLDLGTIKLRRTPPVPDETPQ